MNPAFWPRLSFIKGPSADRNAGYGGTFKHGLFLGQKGVVFEECVYGMNLGKLPKLETSEKVIIVLIRDQRLTFTLHS